jgi:glycosyltransferase involved in cell wall biosynthesis
MNSGISFLRSKREDSLMEVAVIVPCYNEELTIRKVVTDFRKALPAAKIYVIDNNSNDRTGEEALAAGAIVKKECRQGKGFVVQSAFSEIIADIYVMVDGDDTYTASDVHNLMLPIINGDADIATSIRLVDHQPKAFRKLHFLGNRLITRAINSVFNSNLKDVLTGFRVFNKRFVKLIPITSTGFAIETEMTLQGLRHGFVFREIVSPYRERPEGSKSKLNTFRDGFIILKKIISIFVNYRPLNFFSTVAAFFFILSIFAGTVVIYEYIRYSYIYRIPTAILASGSMLMSGISMMLGIVLHVVNSRIKEIEYLLSVKK